MNILVVIGHGRTDSLCHHLQRSVCSALTGLGADVRVEDLLADGFDPVLRIPEGASHALPEHGGEIARRYQEDVGWMDAVVIVHPVWWFAPPAILKGWVDQVLVDGVAIKQPPEGPPKPLLGGRRALVVQTFNAPRVVDRLLTRGLTGSFWRRAVLASVGIDKVERLAFYEVDGISEKALADAERKIQRAVERLVR